MAHGYLAFDMAVGRRKESWEALGLTAWVLTGWGGWDAQEGVGR